MKKNCTRILYQIVFIFFFLISSQTYSQSIFSLNIEKIAEEEKKAFLQLQTSSRGGAETFRTTSASDNFDINYYRCEWEIDPHILFIRGKVTSYFTITSAADKIVFDLSDTLTVDSITYHGNQLMFQRIGNDALQLQFPVVLNIGQKDSVSVYYNGVPRQNIGFHPFVQSTYNSAPVI